MQGTAFCLKHLKCLLAYSVQWSRNIQNKFNWSPHFDISGLKINSTVKWDGNEEFP